MNIKNFALIALCLSVAACGSKNKTSDSQSSDAIEGAVAINDATEADPTSILYVGTYKEVNEDGYDAQLRLWAFEDELQIKLDSFYEERMYVKGTVDPSKAEFIGERGVRLPITLHVIEDCNEVATDDAILSLTELDGNLYKLHVDFIKEPSETSVRNLMADYKLFLTDPNVEHMVQEVPFNINKENIQLVTLLPELNKYVFMPELWNIVKFIKEGQDKDNLAENEIIILDQRNRFFNYPWGDFNIGFQGKYFPMEDGKIMVVMDQHDATYENDQEFHIYIIDPEKKTIVEEEMINVLPQKYLDLNSIFQVRRDTEGVVAVYNEGEDGLDAKTLKFNGRTFEAE